MARVVTPAEARHLGLPGRTSLEIVSGATGAKAVTLRLVEIPVPRPDEPPRRRHRHDDCEECIYVLAGRGTMHAESGEHPLGPGDTVIVPPGEMHVTRNTGTGPLRLLCFFPAAEIAATGEPRDERPDPDATRDG